MEKGQKIVGIHPVKELLETEKEIDKILVSRESNSSDLTSIISAAQNKGIPIQKVPKIKLDKLSSFNHQGVLAFVSPVDYVDLENILETAHQKKETPLILILDALTDTRNFGAICRTAECMGVHGIVILKNGSAPINESVIKSSAGAVLKMNICRLNHLLDAIHFFKASGIQVLSISEKADTKLNEYTPPKEGVALILGSEDKGINKKLISQSDNHLKIQMYGTIESLNVGVAAGMVLYQIKNQLQ